LRLLEYLSVAGRKQMPQAAGLFRIGVAIEANVISHCTDDALQLGSRVSPRLKADNNRAPAGANPSGARAIRIKRLERGEDFLDIALDTNPAPQGSGVDRPAPAPRRP
jgi:hypothetical protein